MTNILGTITNSTGTPLSGILTVLLPSIVTDDSTAPDTIYAPIAQTFTVTAGDLDIDVPETQTYEVPYLFTFRQTGATVDLFAIHAIVPNVSSVQFASFFPTGITSRNLDTSALRIGRLLANDPTLSQLIKQPSIASFPVIGLTGLQTYFMPKPFEGAVLLRSLSVLGLSGYSNWTFDLGIVNSSGNEETLTLTSTSTVTQSGRRRIHQIYSISRAASIMGFFIRATPGVGATALDATLSIAFTEL